jgi:hypothetical protein
LELSTGAGRVGKAGLRYGSQFLLVFAPLITAQWSLLNLLGRSDFLPTDHLQLSFLGLISLDGRKEQVELQLRLILSGLALVAIMAHDLVDSYLPSRSLLEFRKEYLKQHGEEWRKRLGPGIRINIMYARRCWCFLFIWRRFEWSWNSGFDPPKGHHDANLWLTEFQGVCGKALRAGKPQRAFFLEGDPPNLKWHQRYLLCNQFRLWPRQLKKTVGLKGILSIPMFLRIGDESPSHMPVGVINVDSVEEEGARTLQENEEALATYFIEFGMILARLRG